MIEPARIGRRSCLLVAGGVIVTLVGVPLLILPGPGIGAIALGIGMIATGLGWRPRGKR